MAFTPPDGISLRSRSKDRAGAFNLVDDIDRLLQRHCRQLAQRLEAQQKELLERLATAAPTTGNQSFRVSDLEEEELPVVPASNSAHKNQISQEQRAEEPHAAAPPARPKEQHSGRGVEEPPAVVPPAHQNKQHSGRDVANLDGEPSVIGEATNLQPTNPPSSKSVASFFSNEAAQQRRSRRRSRQVTKSSGDGDDFTPSPHGRGLLREHLAKLVNSCCFEGCSCCLILLSVLFFGVETEYMSQNRTVIVPPAFTVFSRVLAVIFTLEVLLHVIVEGSSFLTSEVWFSNVIDVIIVAAALLEIMLDSVLDHDGTTNLTHIRVIRLVRTIRVLRVVRIMKLFRSLRILVYSVLNTLKNLLWVIFMLLVIIYIFALLFTQAANEHIVHLGPGHEEAQDLSHYFGSLALSAYTLFKVITGGLNWEMAADPLQQIGLTWMFIFISFVAFNYLALLNVVMGLVCQTAIESANHDLDVVVQTQLSYQEEYTKNFKDLFKNIDLQDTGILTLQDLEERLQDPKLQDYFAAMDLTTIEAWTLFKLLDANDSSEIDVDEFVTGCLRLRGNARSIDMHMLMYESKWMLKQLANVVRHLKKQEVLFQEHFELDGTGGTEESPKERQDQEQQLLAKLSV